MGKEVGEKSAIVCTRRRRVQRKFGDVDVTSKGVLIVIDFSENDREC